MRLCRLHRRFAGTCAFLVLALATAPAFAAGSNMPWEQPLNQILQSVQGPVAKVISVIIIIVTGLTLAFVEAVRQRRPAREERVWRGHKPRHEITAPHTPAFVRRL